MHSEIFSNAIFRWGKKVETISRLDNAPFSAAQERGLISAPVEHGLAADASITFRSNAILPLSFLIFVI